MNTSNSVQLPVTYWNQFESALFHCLKNTKFKDFQKAWMGVKNRTDFYTCTLLPEISKALNLKLAYEWFDCDFVLLTEKTDIPVIFVESENLARTASTEVKNLCCLSAPVKVLISCCGWHDSYPNGGEQAILLPKWQEIIKQHHDFFPQPSIFGIVIAEWGRPGSNKILRYYSIALENDGQIFSKKTLELP